MTDTNRKKKNFAALCLKDHKVVIARLMRKIADENKWGCKELAEHGKCSISVASFILRGDEERVTLDKLTLIAYELGIAIGMTLVNPNA